MLKSLLVVWVVVALCQAKHLPIYDLEDDFYTELRNILNDHLSQKGAKGLSHPREVRGWGLGLPIGQVTGVAVDHEGNPVVFHRASRIWDFGSFNATHHFQVTAPIEEDTIAVVDKNTGFLMSSWGRGKFYLPHGITIDNDGNVWLTDVGCHQVFKYKPEGDKPLLTLGKANEPGSDNEHFCKPTSVAVASSGEIFVADGYCNSRILKFSAEGTPLGIFGHEGHSKEMSGLFIPHGLGLAENDDTLCIADRENRRILCIAAGLKNTSQFGDPVLSVKEPGRTRIFDVKIIRDVIVGVGGSSEESRAIGFTAVTDSGSVVDEWAPLQGFNNPHAIAVSPEGSCIYVGEIGPNRVWKFVLENQDREKF